MCKTFVDDAIRTFGEKKIKSVKKSLYGEVSIIAEKPFFLPPNWISIKFAMAICWLYITTLLRDNVAYNCKRRTTSLDNFTLRN